MGWKVSLIAGQADNTDISDEQVLDTMDLEQYTFLEDGDLNACIDSPKDRISIGRYRGKLIICAPQRFLRKHFNGEQQESDFVKLFSGSELVMAACNSASNYQAYAFFGKGKKLRFKSIGSGEELSEFGNPTSTEQRIYNQSFKKEGHRIWKVKGEDLREDEMMEVFTFGMLESVIGVNINSAEGEELLEDTPFKTYEVELRRHYPKKKKKNVWLTYVIFFILFIVWQILRKIYSMGA